MVGTAPGRWLEVFWSTFMKLSEGFTRPLYTVLTLIGLALSFLFLSQATRVLPLGTAYAIWTGIGAVGAVVVGIVIFKEPVTALRMVFVVLLLTGIIGLKATSGSLKCAPPPGGAFFCTYPRSIFFRYWPV